MRSVAVGEVTQPVRTWNPRGSRGVLTYIDLSAVDQDAKDITEARPIRCDEAPSRARQLVEEGDVLVSTVRPNLNGVARVPASLRGATASTGFTVLRPRPAVDGAYLFHWVRSPGFVAEMVKKATGASYPAVSDAIVRSSAIPLPSLAAQRRIAAILDQADTLRTKRREAIAAVEALTWSVFVDMFGTPASPKLGLATEQFGALARVTSGKFLPAAAMSPVGAFAVFGGNGQNGSHDEYMFEDPRIAIGRVGAYCGVVHVTPERSWITDNALYLAEFDRRLTFNYLFHALRLANLNQYASQSGQPLISASRISTAPIVVPPLDRQEAFDEAATRIQRSTASAAKQEDSLDSLFASLQDRAFKGEL